MPPAPAQLTISSWNLTSLPVGVLPQPHRFLWKLHKETALMCFLRILLVLSVTLCMLSYSYLFFSPLLLWVFVLFFWYIFSVFPHFPYQGFNFHMKSFSRVPKSCFSIFPPLLIYCTLVYCTASSIFPFLVFSFTMGKHIYIWFGQERALISWEDDFPHETRANTSGSWSKELAFLYSFNKPVSITYGVPQY